jgi:DNA-binding CsgD family transcriptional regulator
VAVVPPERTRSELVRLAHRGLGVRDYSLAAARTVRRAVPFDGVCVLTMDPATLLPTGHVVENALPGWAMPRYSEIEVREPDYNKFTALARARRPAASLSAATGGVLDRSRRHRELRGPSGFGADNTVERADRAARARVRTAAGRWLLVRGSMLGEQVAVILGPLRAPDLAPLIADAYALTARERRVTQLVAQGLPTDAIARALHVSPYTVQDHLKAIFEKAGVSSRGELVARVYFEHYGRVTLEP